MIHVPVLALVLTSPSFTAGSAIPSAHTCEGADRVPALSWSGAPTGTRSLALIVDDPDAPDPKAPQTTWVHWVVYDLPATASGLPAGVTTATLPAGTREGNNDWGTPGWRGPCPPIGRHRYVFKLYALDVTLPPLATADKAHLEQAMRGHVLAQTQLVGTYEKKHK